MLQLFILTVYVFSIIIFLLTEINLFVCNYNLLYFVNVVLTGLPVTLVHSGLYPFIVSFLVCLVFQVGE